MEPARSQILLPVRTSTIVVSFAAALLLMPQRSVEREQVI